MTIKPAIKGLVTRTLWGAAAPKATTPLKGRRMKGVAVHHGAGSTPTNHAACITTWRGYQRMHLAGGRGAQNDIAYNMGICRHGYAFEGRGIKLQGGANGTRESNRTYFSVCLIGNGDVALTEDAKAALLWVIQHFRTKGNAGLEVKRHRDFFATSCPGTKTSAYAATLDGKPILTSVTPTPTPPKENPMPLTTADLAAIRAIVRDEIDSIETARSVWTRHPIVKDTRPGRDPNKRVTPSTLLEGDAS